MELPWKEAHVCSSWWKRGEFQKHVVATTKLNAMPRLFLDEWNDVLYHSVHGTLYWSELDGRGVARQGSLFSHTSDIIDFTAIPQEGTVLTSFANGTVRYWSSYLMKSIQHFKGHAPGSVVIDAAPGKGRFWSGCHRGTVNCWALDPAMAERVTHPRPLHSMEFGARVWSLKTNGEVLVAGVHGTDPLRVFDAGTSQRLFEPQTQGAHRQSVFGIHLAEDGSSLTTGSFDGSVALWDLRQGRPVMVLEDPADEPVYCVQHDGGWRVVTGVARYSSCRIWDIRNKSLRLLSPERNGPSSPVYSLHFDDYRLFLATATKVEILSLGSL